MATPTAPVPSGRTLRVFISSTFRDMQAERDELVKRVFPRLRALCESRQVEWSEVDLRWGISDEQVAEGRALPICLAEIEACRPFFIGLLADRYGWVPGELPDRLIEAEPWLADHRGRSITELEIVKGVLADPARAEHAFFYFRDPGYAQALPADRRADLLESAAEPARLLADLKDRIRASGLPVRGNYPDPRSLGDLVYADLAAVIERRFPVGPVAERWQLEREGQGFYRASHRAGYVPRPAWYQELDDHAAGAGAPLFVVGPPGRGKSALLANWIEHHRARRPEVAVFSHFAAATPESGDADLAMWRLVGEIRRYRGQPPLDPPRSPGDLRRRFVETLGDESDGRAIVVVIDGVDAMRQPEGSPGAEWIPREVARSVRLVVSSFGPSVFKFGMPPWRPLFVAGLEPDERRLLAERYLGRFAKALAGPLLDRIVTADAGANPLYLRLLLDELRVFGDHENLSGRIDHYLAMPAVVPLYHRILSRWEADYDVVRPGLVRDSLRLLLASRSGLAESELLDLLGGNERLPQGIWAPFRAGAAGSLAVRSGRIALANRPLRLAVAKRYAAGPEVERGLHSRLAGYFNRRGPTERTFDELPYQLMKAGEWHHLATLLAQPEYLVSAWQKRPGDLRRFWAQVEAKSPIRMPAAMAPLLAVDPIEPAVARVAAVLLYEFRHFPEAERLASRWVAEVRTSASSDLPAALHLLGAARAKLGQLDGALAIYQEEEALAVKAGREDAIEFAWQGQALVALARGELDQAEELFRRIETEAIGGRRDAMAAVALDNQAIILLKRGDATGALALHERAEPLFRAAGDELGVARSFGNRGSILLKLRRLSEASAAYQSAGEWFRRLGDGRSALRTLQDRGNLLFRTKAFDDAVEVCREHAELARQLGDLDALQGGLGNEAVALRRLGRFDEAVVRLEEQARVCREMNDPELLGGSLLRRAAVLHNRLGRTADAMAVAREAEDVATRAGLPELASEAQELLASLKEGAAPTE